MFFKSKRKEVEAAAEQANIEQEAQQPVNAAVDASVDDSDSVAAEEQAPDTSKSAPADRETAGPFDLTEVPSIKPYIDLGGIKLAPRAGLSVRLDVDEQTQRIIAASLDYEGSTLQVQAFAAPKSTGLWHEIRAEIYAALKAQGALVSEVAGPFGQEVVMRSAPDAPQQAAVRFFGVDGPRWLLRGVLIGAGALDPSKAEGVESVFRDIVVVRGDRPMAPNDLLPLHPPGAVHSMQSADDIVVA